MTALKVGVAMSGGVDSTMAASLLQEQGHAVHGFFMILPLADLEAQQLRVREAAERLSLPLTLVDGQIALAGRYPSRDDLARWAGLAVPAAAKAESAGNCCSGGNCG